MQVIFKMSWITWIVILLWGINGYGQYQVQNKPVKYINPLESVSLPSSSDEKTDIPWFVYSDRSNNPVYQFGTGQEIHGKLDFGVELAVLDVNADGSRLLVAYEKDIVGRELEDDANPVGWVDSDKLLLWEKSLVDDQYGIDKKAMILFTIDAARQHIEETGEFTSDVPVFKEPSDQRFDTLGFHQGLFQFFPVFKKEGDYLLLGQSLKLDNSKENNGLKGWVSKDNVSEWSHRVAWEKNWEIDAIEERKENTDNIGVMVLEDPSEAQQYANTNRKIEGYQQFVRMESPYLEMTFESNRKPGPMGRFPILDIEEISVANQHDQSRPIKVGVIGEVMDLDGDVIDIEQLYNMTEEIKVLRNVNILFVIDATESMDPYSRSVIKGVKDAMRAIKSFYEREDQQDDKNKFLFGCVLYRDNHVKTIVDRFGSDFSQDTARFFNWLGKHLNEKMNIRREGFTGRDDLEEAMYYGIQTALDDYGPDERMSNYMILIGDCGDHQDSTDARLKYFVEQSTLIEDLQWYNMNLLAFQVHHNTPSAYELFNQQTKEIIQGIGDTSLIKNPDNSFLFELPAGSQYTGKLLSCPLNSRINVDEMAKLISENIIQINKDVNGKIKNIAKALRGQSDLDPWSTAKVIKFFADNDFTVEEAEKITTSGMNQEYEVGYTVLKCAGYDKPNYKTVVLYSREELEDVVNAFMDLSAASGYPPSEQRIRLKKAMEEWFPKYFSGVQKEKLYDMAVGELLERITGLNFGEKYQSITISKITDPRRITNKELKTFVDDLDRSLQKLEKIYKESRVYPARVEIPGDTKTLYVYIPGDVFPHE